MAENAEILAGLAKILTEATAGAAQNVTAEKSFVEDLDIDSLTMVEIAIRIEEEFGVKIPDNEFTNLKTVGEAVNYVSANTK